MIVEDAVMSFITYDVNAFCVGGESDAELDVFLFPWLKKHHFP